MALLCKLSLRQLVQRSQVLTLDGGDEVLAASARDCRTLLRAAGQKNDQPSVRLPTLPRNCHSHDVHQTVPLPRQWTNGEAHLRFQRFSLLLAFTAGWCSLFLICVGKPVFLDPSHVLADCIGDLIVRDTAHRASRECSSWEHEPEDTHQGRPCWPCQIIGQQRPEASP